MPISSTGDVFKMQLRSGTWIETVFEDSIEGSVAFTKCNSWSRSVDVSRNITECHYPNTSNCTYSYNDVVKRVLHLNSLTSLFKPYPDQDSNSDLSERMRTRSASRSERSEFESVDSFCEQGTKFDSLRRRIRTDISKS